MKPDLQEEKQGDFITQEDIDTALRAFRRPEKASESNEAAPLFLDESNIVDSGSVTDSEDADYLGLLSKEDIEALLHGDLDGSGEREAQDEIDSLVQTTVSEKDAPPPTETTPSDIKKEAQENVDRQIQNAASDTAATARVDAAANTEPSEEGAAVSQDDIDRLLNSALGDTEDQTETEMTSGMVEPELNEAVSQDDIDRLLTTDLENSGDEVATEAGIGPAAPETDGVVSQDDIDQLLASDSDDKQNDAETDVGKASSIEPEVVSDSGNSAESQISPSDADQLTEEAFPESGTETPSSAGTQSSSDHISQDDINRLLKESLSKAETPSEEEADDVAGGDLQESGILAVEEEPAEPVPVAPAPELKPVQVPRKLFNIGPRKNHLIWAVAAGIVLLASITLVVMSSGPSETVSQSKMLTFSVPQVGVAPARVTGSSKNSVYLSGFVVLAPPNSVAVAYVTADLFLDFSDASIVSVIKENEAFVRDIIYGTIQNELMSRDISAIDEISLELAIRKALGSVVDREAIQRVAFERFSLV